MGPFLHSKGYNFEYSTIKYLQTEDLQTSLWQIHKAKQNAPGTLCQLWRSLKKEDQFFSVKLNGQMAQKSL